MEKSNINYICNEITSAIFGLTKLKFAANFDTFKTTDSEYLKNNTVLENNFESYDQIIVLIEY